MFRFLLVDDSRVMRRMLQNALRENGFEDCQYLEAVDGKNALAELEKADYRVDLVLCDLCMPNLDGIGLIEALGKEGRLDTTPVIVLSGDIREGRAREALEKGAKRLVGKPFCIDAVKDAVDEVLRAR